MKKKVIERIVKSPGSPDTNDMWLDDNLNLNVYDNGKWKTISGGEDSGEDDGSGSDFSLSDMTDVDISSPSDGDTLVYNATTHKWENGSGGSGCDCLAPMIVSGTVDDNAFTPVEGAPTWAEAQEQMFNGGLVYLVITYDGEPVGVELATLAGLSIKSSSLTWSNPDAGGVVPVG